jgi:hypothetical protein
MINGKYFLITFHLNEILVGSDHEYCGFVFCSSVGSLGWLSHCDKHMNVEFEVFLGGLNGI